MMRETERHCMELMPKIVMLLNTNCQVRRSVTYASPLQSAILDLEWTRYLLICEVLFVYGNGGWASTTSKLG